MTRESRTPTGPNEHIGGCLLHQVALLAEGGMSLTWLVHRAGHPANHLFVLKQLHPRLESNQAAIRALHMESALSTHLRHPCLVQGLPARMIERKLFMPMEFVFGDNLHAIFRQTVEVHEELPIGLSIYLGLQITDALRYVHAHSDPEGNAIVHRDVSPQNILVGYDGHVRLIDFGVASPTRLLGQLHGKFPYMSPEQVLGMPVTPASDIFSLGAVLWEACANRRLFFSPSPLESARRIASGDVPRLSTLESRVSPAYEALIHRALALDPAARPSADEFHHALLTLDDGPRLSPHDVASYMSFYGPQARERLDHAALLYFRRPLPTPVALDSMNLHDLAHCAVIPSVHNAWRPAAHVRRRATVSN